MREPTDDLRIYKRLGEWNATTLPQGFRRKHNTKKGTWAQLTVRAGALRFEHLDADGEEASSTSASPRRGSTATSRCSTTSSGPRSR